ncbi:MAG: HD domain-containing protein [Defluviitaleaceae bacterium]|nr:HD domain-containing protein [Defluviitaleaceae bacterium]
MNTNAASIYPSRSEAEAILLWAQAQNPGPWISHCRNAARAAETIATHCGMDTNRAYASGLLHDIGYYANADRSGKVCHVYAGYALMMERGYPTIADICLSHSFPIQNIHSYTGSQITNDENERAIIKKYLAEAEYDDYHKLTQLCDGIGGPQGLCTLEQRLVDAHRRHGLDSINTYTFKKWDAYFALKEYFDAKCDCNVYDLFRDEIAGGIFGH